VVLIELFNNPVTHAEPEPDDREIESAGPARSVVSPPDRRVLEERLSHSRRMDRGRSVVSVEQREDRAEFRLRLRTLASRLTSLPPPNGIAPFAEGIAAALNQNCNFWRLSRSASVIERKGIGWLPGLLLDPETSGGVL
jgi:hypothetical protein